MRLGRVGQRIGVRHPQGQLSGRGQPRQPGQGRAVGVDVYRHHPDAAHRDRAGAAEGGERTPGPNRVESRVAEHGRVEDRVRAAGNKVTDRGGQLGRARDELRRAQLAGQFFVRISGRGDHPQAAHGREFHDEGAEPASGPGHQHGLTGGQGEGIKRLERGQAIERDRRGGLTAAARGRGGDIGRVEDHPFGIGSQRLVQPVPQPDHPFSGCRTGDVRTDRIDDAGHIPADAHVFTRADHPRPARVHEPLAGSDVDGIHRRGLDADPDLTAPRFGDRYVDERQRLRPAVDPHDNSTHSVLHGSVVPAFVHEPMESYAPYRLRGPHFEVR